MKTNAPKQVTWIISVVAGALGILGYLAVVPPLAPYAFWLVCAGFVILALASVLEGL
jgi:hypothetical protein